MNDEAIHPKPPMIEKGSEALSDAQAADSAPAAEGAPEAEEFRDEFTDEPTRVAPVDYDVLAAQALGRAPKHNDLVAQELAAAKACGFDREETRVSVPPEVVAAPVDEALAQTPRMASAEEPPEFDAEDETEEHVAGDAESAGRVVGPEEIYRSQVAAEISFSKSTGYDKESTAVVPLAELARREEERLKKSGQVPAAETEASAASDEERALPMGEIIDVLRAAHTVEEVAGVLVEIVANMLPRVLLLWQRHGHLVGFASRGTPLTQVKLLTLEMPLGVLREMTAASLDLETFVGPPRMSGQASKFFDLLGYAPKEILIIPGTVTPQDRWLLYADNGPKPLPQLELRLMEVIVARAGARADLLLDRSLLW